ncbi:MAG: histidine kinase, partial [Flavobacteriaceae bacterium]|nr:histidine kinase [Flavobacteriaceae bacterium]
MKFNRYILSVAFLLFGYALFAQVDSQSLPSDKIYSDRITDQNGNPLSGITVRVQGTTMSTLTDSNGRFSINAKNGDVIVLSKNGKIINSYRLNGSVYYEVRDQSDQLQEAASESRSISKSSKFRTDNTAAFNSLLDSANYLIKADPTQSIDYVEKALQLANASGNKTQIALSYSILGDIYMRLKQYDLASDNYRIAYTNAKNANTQLQYARALLLSGNYKESEGQYNALKMAGRLTTAQQIELHEGLGDIYYRMNQLNDSEAEYQTALELAKRGKNWLKIAELNTKLSVLLEAKGQTQKAERFLLQANDSIVNSNPANAAIASKRVADFYSRNQQVDKEVVQRKQTLENLEKGLLNNVVDEDQGVNITRQRAKLDLGNALLKQKNVQEAIPVLEESAEEAKNTNDIETQKDAVQKLSEAYVYLGDDDKALSNYKKYVALVDELYRAKEKEINAIVNLNKNLTEKQSRINSLEKDRELNESKMQLFQTERELTEENYRRQKMIIYSLIGGVLLLLFSLFWMFRSNKQRRLANNLLALKSLRTQMNPHFIFNALNSVNNFIAQNDERAANRYLTDFSTLMRSVLENSEEDFIPLEKEIELLQLYLKLEHSRFRDKFDYELIVDKHIDIGQFEIPPMLLQPYVENAVWHGLRYKEEKGFLKVELQKKD